MDEQEKKLDKSTISKILELLEKNGYNILGINFENNDCIGNIIVNIASPYLQ